MPCSTHMCVKNSLLCTVSTHLAMHTCVCELHCNTYKFHISIKDDMDVENKITTIAYHSHCRGFKDRVIMRDWNLKLNNSDRTGKVLKTASVRNPKNRKISAQFIKKNRLTEKNIIRYQTVFDETLLILKKKEKNKELVNLITSAEGVLHSLGVKINVDFTHYSEDISDKEIPDYDEAEITKTKIILKILLERLEKETK